MFLYIHNKGLQLAWTKIFDLIQEKGNIPEREMYNVFNMGLGFIVAALTVGLPAGMYYLGVSAFPKWIKDYGKNVITSYSLHHIYNDPIKIFLKNKNLLKITLIVKITQKMYILMMLK